LNKWFNIFFVFFRLFFFTSPSLHDSVCFDFPSLCDVFFLFPVVVRCLFDSCWNISFEQVQIRSMTMTLASSTLQIRRHEYSGDLNLVIFVGTCTFPFYAINVDVVSLFTDSSFLLLANLDLYCIEINLNEWISFIFVKKKLLLFGCEIKYHELHIWRKKILIIIWEIGPTKKIIWEIRINFILNPTTTTTNYQHFLYSTNKFLHLPFFSIIISCYTL